MSEVKVNKISPRTNCGTTQLGDAGDTITVTGDLKSNSLKSASGSTITLGQSGDTIQLGCGATQTGFGRTGTVDWQTGSIKTATFTAANGEGYFCNTAGGGFTMNLPAGSAGAIVSLQDYNNTFDTNALTVATNGSEKINGGDAGGILSLFTKGEGLTLVYVDATVGWRSIQDSNFSNTSSSNLVATGGTITCCGDYRIHTFTGPGTFAVSRVSDIAAENTVSYLVVAGGGGGGTGCGTGGGGGGGFREFRAPVSGCYAVSPLNGATPITVTATTYPITVGAGGVASGNGNPSTFSVTTSTGGGAGGPFGTTGGNGGSGGGGGGRSNTAGGSGNTPPTSPPQGNGGGNAAPSSSPPTIDAGGAGGGAGGSGPSASDNTAREGGVGVLTSITGSSTAYAGGGGGSAESLNHGGGSPCGTGGAGGTPGGTPGASNTGGGGGGSHGCAGATGGSGVVIIRYKYQ
jgi:hypothetical protein